MKIYTRNGDKGKTSLVGGERVLKDSVKVESYGTVDELNSLIGVVRAFHNEKHSQREDCNIVENEFRRMQNNLLNIGSYLATPSVKRDKNTIIIKEDEIKHLEEFIDNMDKDLKPLKTFILPGGGKISAFLHNARTVCRRAERRMISLSELEEIHPLIFKYINRLSDVLFTLARWEAHNHNEPEYYWEK